MMALQPRHRCALSAGSLHLCLLRQQQQKKKFEHCSCAARPLALREESPAGGDGRGHEREPGGKGGGKKASTHGNAVLRAIPLVSRLAAEPLVLAAVGEDAHLGRELIIGCGSVAERQCKRLHVAFGSKSRPCVSWASCFVHLPLLRFSVAGHRGRRGRCPRGRRGGRRRGPSWRWMGWQ